MDIFVNVVNQKLKVATNLKNIVEGSQEFVKFSFNFDSDWDGLTTFAQFLQNGIAYNVYLDSNNSCYLPPEIRTGTVTLILYGTGGNVIATTNYVTFTVDENILVANAQSTEITLSLYQQLVNMVSNYNPSQISARIDLKADLSALTAEIQRAKATEAQLLSEIDTKASGADLTSLANRVTSLENGSAYDDQIEEAVANEISALLASGALAEMTIANGTISRRKVDANFEETLLKADTAMQASVYDPLGYGLLENPVNPYSFAIAQDTVSKNNLLNTEQIVVTDSSVSETSTTYSGLVSALSGVLNRSELYASALLNNYSPFYITIVNELPSTGTERTFYLVPKENGDGYDKWWYITDENNNPVWDNFGSSTTEIVSELPLIGNEDTDYILVANGEYQYYKYIGNQWALIAGSTAEVLGENPNISSGYNKYIFGNGYPAEELATETNFNNGIMFLDISTMVYYVISNNNGIYSWNNGGALISNPSQSKDYFIQDDNSTWGHFRFIGTNFVQIGSSAYTRNQIDDMVNSITANLSGDISDIASDVSALVTRLNNLGNLVKDVSINPSKTEITVTYEDNASSTIELNTGIDIDSAVYNIENDYTLHFYDSNGNELENLSVLILGGGGGGGGSSTGGSASINRITTPNIQCVYGDSCVIEYSVIATDAGGDGVGDGVGTLYVNNIAVTSGFRVTTSDIGSINSIDVGEFLSVGTNNIKISVSVDTGGETNSIATKTWSVNAINMYFTWNYIDSQINTSAVTDYYTPYGAINKTIYTFIDIDPLNFNPEIVDSLPDTTEVGFNSNDIADIDYFVQNGNNYIHYKWNNSTSRFDLAEGYLLDANTTTRSGVQQSLTIPMQEHGSHVVARFISSTVNDTTIKTAVQIHDMAFYVAGETAPIISASFNTYNMIQYNTVQIPIVVYDPNRTSTTVILSEDGNVVSTWTNVDRTIHYWNYSPTTYGIKTLTISCGATVKTLKINVEELNIDESEVNGYDFKFKSSEMATNDSVKNWSAEYRPMGSDIPQVVDITFSDNFDWVNGGLHTEYDENNHLRQYFAIRAGTSVTFNYNLFGNNYDPKQFGKAFKFIFKAVNCRNYDAKVLECMDKSNGNNGVGLVMTANEATFSTANNTIKTYYYKDSYIEFETNIHPNTEYPYLQIWVDGSPDSTKLYDSSDSMQQTSPVGITIGSPDCDVYIYLLKAYPVYLTNNNIISNFIMDSPNAYEMVDRYNKNDILNASGEIDYQKLATANPDLHVLLLDLNRMTTGKKDNAVAHTVRHIYNRGGESHCFTINNACVTVQGTSSVGYLESAGNVDINFKYNRTFTSDNVEYTTGHIAFDNGNTSTSGFAMSENSIPVDYLNVKVNVASSENANNACIADWYNTYQPWLSPAKEKNPKARDTMEFVPGVIFIRDRSGGLFYTKDNEGRTIPETTGYHFYGICDIGNSKKNTKVFHDTKNPLAVCVEVANNTSLPCIMASKEYSWNSDDEATVIEIENGEEKEQTVFEFRYIGDGVESIAESAWDRFVSFLVDYNPNLATNEPIPSTTFGRYTFKGTGKYDTSAYESDDYKVIYLYGYGIPSQYNGGIYSASSYVTDTSNGATCYYYINYSNDYIYSSNGTSWVAVEQLSWVADRNNVIAGTTIGTYAGTYTTDSYNYRMAYILEHCEEYMIIDPVIYHFIFIESFLMTDNVAKNTFWSSDDLVHWEPSKDYDNDTALGNDNVGGLSFTYGLETDDIIGSGYVFNAHDASWITFCRGLFDACQVMYINRESAGCFNSENFLAKVKRYQNARPERIWVADAQRKYLRPYEDNGTITYLPMLAGTKTHQREQVKVYNAYYYASKYVSNFCTSQNIMLRGNTPTTWTGIAPQNKATISMYINCYIVVASTSYHVVAKTKAVRGQSYVMDFSTIGSMGETELYFCTAPMITELSGLAHLYFKQNNFGMGTNLQRLEIGSSVSGYSNPNLENLTIGNNRMLEYLDVRNCPNATGALDLSGCVSLSELYLENTAFSGITFATGGLLEIAHLPSPTSLTMRELIYLDDLSFENVNNLSSLRIEDCDFDDSTRITIGETTTPQSYEDIIIILINASSNLSRVRLVGIDWSLPDNTLLSRLINMAGINDASYDITQSVVTGNVFIPTVKSGLYGLYTTTWEDLSISYSTLIAQYLATFINSNGDPIYGRDGRPYTQWVDSGSRPYDPITMGFDITISDNGNPVSQGYSASSYNNNYYLDMLNGIVYKSNGSDWNFISNTDVLTPTIPSTEQYFFTFSGWDNMQNMTNERTITAQYQSTVRTYTVRWWKYYGIPLETQTNVPYGACVTYSGDVPQDTSNEASYTYSLFAGWDKSTGFIKEDLDVYARWETLNALPSIGTDMSVMTPIQIYAVAKSGYQDSYFEECDYTDIILGQDFNFDNVQDCEIGKDISLTGIPRDTYQSGGYYFNGNSIFTTDIQLFSESSPSFTMAIDFQFAENAANTALLSCNEGATSIMSLYSNGDGACVSWGDQSVYVGKSKYRYMVVIRHIKGSKYLYVYSTGGNDSQDANAGSGWQAEVAKTNLLSTTLPQTEFTLSFGGIKYPNGSRNYGKGNIHWCKIWFDDIGDDCAYALANWTHEKIRMEYIGSGRYYYYGTTDTTKLSFICNQPLGGRPALGYCINSTATVEGGWGASEMRTFCNERIYKALPLTWQSMIKTVETNYMSGGSSRNISTIGDKVYLPSKKEAGSTDTGQGYISEVGIYSTPIPWLSSAKNRVKFYGTVRKYEGDPDYTFYSCEQDPSALYQKEMKRGDIWQNTSEGNSPLYIFAPQEEIDHYGITSYKESSSDYGSSGGWLIARRWWTRSYDTRYAAFNYYIHNYGYIEYSQVVTSYNGVVPCFSI